MKFKANPSTLALHLVRTSPNCRFMSKQDVRQQARLLDQRCVNSMTPNPRRMIRWKPVVRITRHFVFIGIVRVAMTGLTGSEQYAALWSATGDWKKATKIQLQFNSQFPRDKRLTAQMPGRVIT